MRDELYMEVAKKYLDKFNKIIEDYNPIGRYLDISGNLVNCLLGNAGILDKLEKNGKKESKKTFIRSLKATKIYFKMLENFPEFKESELYLRDGYFPDLTNYVYNSENAKKERKQKDYSGVHMQYVFLAKEKLME